MIALQNAAEIFEYFGLTSEAEKYRNLGEQIKTSLYERCFDEARVLIAETPDREVFSQHTNIWAILSSTIPESPNFGNLTEMKVSFPHPEGMLFLDLKKDRKNRLTGTITLPENILGELDWCGTSIKLFPEDNPVSLR